MRRNRRNNSKRINSAVNRQISTIAARKHHRLMERRTINKQTNEPPNKSVRDVSGTEKTSNIVRYKNQVDRHVRVNGHFSNNRDMLYPIYSSMQCHLSCRFPKTMHFFWSGASMCFYRFISVLSFVRLNPDWRVVIHTCNEVSCAEAYENNINQDFLTAIMWKEDYLTKLISFGVEVQEHNIGIKNYDQVLNPVFKSDIGRWQVLYDTGGLYADTDILFIKPIDEYFKQVRVDINNVDIITSFINGVSIAIAGGKPRHPYFKSLIDTAAVRYSPKEYESMGAKTIIHLLGSKDPSECLGNLKFKYRGTEVCNLSHDSFSALLPEQIFSPLNNNCIVSTKQSLAIHWYGGSSFSLNHKYLLPRDILTNNNVLNYYIRKIFCDIDRICLL